MKTVISIPDRVYESAEKLADRLGQSRSQLYTKALSSYIEKNQEKTSQNDSMKFMLPKILELTQCLQAFKPDLYL